MKSKMRRGWVSFRAFHREIGRLLALVAAALIAVTATAAMAAESITTAVLDPAKKCSITIYKQLENGYDGAVSEGTGLVQENSREGMKGIVFAGLRIASMSSYVMNTENGAVTHGVLFTDIHEGFRDLYQKAAGRTLAAQAVTDGKTVGYTAETMQAVLNEIIKSGGDGKTWTGQSALTALACSGTGFAATDAEGRTEMKGLEQGLYLIGEDLAASSYEGGNGSVPAGPCVPFLLSLPMTNKGKIGTAEAGTVWQYDVTAYPKNTVISTSKYIVSEEDGKTLEKSGDRETGESFSQIITGDAPVPAAISGDHTDREYVKYVLKDAMTEGMEFERVTAVQIGAKTTAPQTTEAFAAFQTLSESDYTVSEETNGFEVELTKSGLEKLNRLQVDAEVIVRFETRLNEKAVIGGEEDGLNTNRPTLIWRNRDDLERRTEGPAVNVYTYGLELTKTGLTNPEKAVFKILSKENGPVLFIKEKEGRYRVAAEDEKGGSMPVSPAKDGLLVIRGFDEGTYVFKETETQSGFSLLRSSFEITFTANRPLNGYLLKAEVKTEGKTAGLRIKNEGSSGVAQLTVANHAELHLKTGGSGSGRIIMLAGAGCFAVMMLTAVLGRRKRRHE
ncbi:MAG: SpaH/EbpB family LPXTG-anchored major pilin [Lachnospiraceae bacterium]|nr:SpaH/EbpB family LPXTG-anchored major pilin [Lachnospiraceae bacterium]